MSNFKIQRPKIHGFPETRMQKVKKLQEWKEIKRKYTYTVWSSKTSSSLQKTLFPTPKTNLYLATSRLARSTGHFRNPPSVWTKVRSRTMRSCVYTHTHTHTQNFNSSRLQSNSDPNWHALPDHLFPDMNSSQSKVIVSVTILLVGVCSRHFAKEMYVL